MNWTSPEKLKNVVELTEGEFLVYLSKINYYRDGYSDCTLYRQKGPSVWKTHSDQIIGYEYYQIGRYFVPKDMVSF